MKKIFLFSFFVFVCISSLLKAQNASHRSITEILNSDGTIRKGIEGSFNAQGFEMKYGKNGEPIFLPKPQDITEGTWSPLGTVTNNGVSGDVNVVLVSGNSLFVGGKFSNAVGVSANGIARYDLTLNTWHSLGNGTSNGVGGPYPYVRALAVTGNNLFVGGEFHQAGGVTVNFVARYDLSTGTWYPLGTGTSVGVNGTVNALVIMGNNLFVGGQFTEAGGISGGISANRVARFDLITNTWHSLGSGTGNGVNSIVNALAVSGNYVFVGGGFSIAGGLPANCIARFDFSTNTWSSLGTGNSNGVNNVVYALNVLGNNLFVGGAFTQAGGLSSNYIVRFDLTNNTWHSLGSGNSNGVSNHVFAITFSGDNLFVGGLLAQAGSINANYVARYDLSSNNWYSLGTGNSNGVNFNVRALSVYGENVFIGGLFTQAGGISVNRIARYSGWSNASVTSVKTVSSDETILFDSTGASVSFTGVSGSGTATVSRYESPASNITFSGTPPRVVSQYRFVISATGFTFNQAELHINRTQLSGNGGINNPATVRIYVRQTPGLDVFSPLPNTYNTNTPDEVRATTTTFGEFILASDDTGNILPVDEDEKLQKQFSLDQNYPNPFNPSTTISFTIPQSEFVTLKVYDMLGREVATLVNEYKPAGTYNVQFSTVNNQLSSGVYFYKLQAGKFSEVKKMILAK